MKQLNIDLASLKTAAADTAGAYPRGCRTDIFFDRETGEVWGRFIDNPEWWVSYRNYPEIIQVGSTRRKLTKKAIEAMIRETLAEERHIYREIGWEYPEDWM